MHHFLSKPDWLQEVNEYLPKNGSLLVLDFDKHFIYVENDWLSGREPEDVAEAIAKGEHQHIPQNLAPFNPADHENQR